MFPSAIYSLNYIQHVILRTNRVDPFLFFPNTIVRFAVNQYVEHKTDLAKLDPIGLESGIIMSTSRKEVSVLFNPPRYINGATDILHAVKNISDTINTTMHNTMLSQPIQVVNGYNSLIYNQKGALV